MKRATFLMAFAVILVLAGPVVRAGTSDDTLKYYLSKSELIVSGKITNEPMCIFHEAHMPDYICEFQVQDVLKGDAELKGQPIKVHIHRFELSDKDRNPLIKLNSECILLLNSSQPRLPHWDTVDIWFGIQPASAAMAHSFTRLAAAK